MRNKLSHTGDTWKDERYTGTYRYKHVEILLEYTSKVKSNYPPGVSVILPIIGPFGWFTNVPFSLPKPAQGLAELRLPIIYIMT